MLSVDTPHAQVKEDSMIFPKVASHRIRLRLFINDQFGGSRRVHKYPSWRDSQSILTAIGLHCTGTPEVLRHDRRSCHNFSLQMMNDRTVNTTTTQAQKTTPAAMTIDLIRQPEPE
jgi:hypothetical protein